MGFFSDLKEDLSQAVNELKTDEERSKKEKQAVVTEAEGQPETTASVAGTAAASGGL